MTATQFRSALDRLGLSQTDAARVFGTEARSIRRYVAGDREVPEQLRKLVRLALDGVITVGQIEAA